MNAIKATSARRVVQNHDIVEERKYLESKAARLVVAINPVLYSAVVSGP